MGWHGTGMRRVVRDNSGKRGSTRLGTLKDGFKGFQIGRNREGQSE